VFGTAENAATKLQRGPTMSLPTNCKAQIEISFKSIMLSESGLLAKSIYAAIGSDTKMCYRDAAASGSKTKITITKDEDTNSSLLLELETSDIAALRAAINSYLRLINASLKICEASVTDSR
jgi:tRNA threonylcarbamoyladenosine modification (KEOPS) complex  Pcc1 subunit